MDNDRIWKLHTLLKRDDREMFFQFTRSSDSRLIKCKAILNDEHKLAKGVAKIVEYDLNIKREKTNAPFSDDILDHFFSFTSGKLSSDCKDEPGVYSTTCKALPGRQLYVHTLNDKYFMTTMIGGLENTAVLGVHVTIDIPASAPPLLQKITIYGYNKHHKMHVSENLSIAEYLSQFAKLYLTR